MKMNIFYNTLFKAPNHYKSTGAYKNALLRRTKGKSFYKNQNKLNYLIFHKKGNFFITHKRPTGKITRRMLKRNFINKAGLF